MAKILESTLPKEDRVRRNTAHVINQRLDDEMHGRVDRYRGAPHEDISRRLVELDQEWDIERFLEMNAAGLALAGVLASLITGNKKWLFLSGSVLGFLLQHALQGWCPPMPLFRRLGVRTRQEIDREKSALAQLSGEGAI